MTVGQGVGMSKHCIGFVIIGEQNCIRICCGQMSGKVKYWEGSRNGKKL